MYSKAMTATYHCAQHDLDTAVTQHRTMLRDTLQSCHTIGQTLFDEQVAPDVIRTMVFQHIPPERLQRQLQRACQPCRLPAVPEHSSVLSRGVLLHQRRGPHTGHAPIANCGSRENTVLKLPE
jgi:hypothetical protein